MAVRNVALCLALLSLAASAFGSDYTCPSGQVYDFVDDRCKLCDYGYVKYQDLNGNEDAYCRDASEVCGTSEYAKWGSCARCPFTQVANADYTKCVSCPPGTIRWPTGSQKNAYCKPNPVCVPETCNGKDDDCDGKVDEDLGTKSCGVGYCKKTVPACIGGKQPTCTEGKPRTETCNNIDDDCDGIVDNVGSTIYCTPCNKAVSSCKNGLHNNCAYVCDTPCCEDCWKYNAVPAEKQWCTSSCQDCANSDKCLGYADDVSEYVAEKACEDVNAECGASVLLGFSDGRQVTRTQCYELAYDECVTHGTYYAKSGDSLVCKPYLSGSTGTCTRATYQSKFLAKLKSYCNDESIDIAFYRTP